MTWIYVPFDIWLARSSIEANKFSLTLLDLVFASYAKVTGRADAMFEIYMSLIDQVCYIWSKLSVWSKVFLPFLASTSILTAEVTLGVITSVLPNLKGAARSWVEFQLWLDHFLNKSVFMKRKEMWRTCETSGTDTRLMLICWTGAPVRAELSSVDPRICAEYRTWVLAKLTGPILFLCISSRAVTHMLVPIFEPNLKTLRSVVAIIVATSFSFVFAKVSKKVQWTKTVPVRTAF